MEKIEIANEVLKNTENVYLKEFVAAYINNLQRIEDKKSVDMDLLRFDCCVSYIQKTGFDISGWMLREIPVEYAHVFWNEKTNQMFDLDVFDLGEAIPTYIDSNSNEASAASIEEAIKNYCM